MRPPARRARAPTRKVEELTFCLAGCAAATCSRPTRPPVRHEMPPPAVSPPSRRRTFLALIARFSSPPIQISPSSAPSAAGRFCFSGKTMQQFHVVVPPGVGPGGTFHARVGATTVAVQVPPGCGPGTKLAIQAPAVAQPRPAAPPPRPAAMQHVSQQQHRPGAAAARPPQKQVMQHVSQHRPVQVPMAGRQQQQQQHRPMTLNEGMAQQRAQEGAQKEQAAKLKEAQEKYAAENKAAHTKEQKVELQQKRIADNQARQAYMSGAARHPQLTVGGEVSALHFLNMGI